jgi:MFS family permease
MTATTTTPESRCWLVLALLAVAQFVVVLDASIMNIALPSIGTELDVSQESLSWIINGYVLTFGGFLLLGGRLADLLGRRRVFVAGLVVFAAASLAGGLASSSSQLIAARAVQGLGGGAARACRSFDPDHDLPGRLRAQQALGVWGAVAGSGGAAGVLLGGIITEALGWEWVLFINVPIAIAAALLSFRLIAESRAEVAGIAMTLVKHSYEATVGGPKAPVPPVPIARPRKESLDRLFGRYPVAVRLVHVTPTRQRPSGHSPR